MLPFLGPFELIVLCVVGVLLAGLSLLQRPQDPQRSGPPRQRL